MKVSYRRSALAISQTILLLVSPLSVLLSSPAEAATTSTASSSAVANRLNKIEEVIYGAPKKGETLDTRLKALEVKLFGIPRKGTLDQRLANIDSPLLRPWCRHGRPAAASGTHSRYKLNGKLKLICRWLQYCF